MAPPGPHLMPHMMRPPPGMPGMPLPGMPPPPGYGHLRPPAYGVRWTCLSCLEPGALLALLAEGPRQ